MYIVFVTKKLFKDTSDKITNHEERKLRKKDGTIITAQLKQTEWKVSAADIEAVKQTALDYIEAWYEGDGDKRARVLHPNLSKRTVKIHPKTGRSTLELLSQMSLVELTRSGVGTETLKEKQQKDITILNVFGNAASVKIVASYWVDYLHIAKFNGEWVIVNVLWEMKPTKNKIDSGAMSRCSRLMRS